MIGSINYNILRLNDVTDGVFGDEEPLYVLAGEWSGRNKLTMYETERSLEDVVRHDSAVTLEVKPGDTLGICICGVLNVIVITFYFIIAVNRKQKNGLIILFLSPIPRVIRVDNYTCILRHVAPTLAFSIVLSSWVKQSVIMKVYLSYH